MLPRICQKDSGHICFITCVENVARIGCTLRLLKLSKMSIFVR